MNRIIPNKKKCDKCEHRLTAIQKQAINDYKTQCYKLYIEQNKFFEPLLHKTYLFFDIANYINISQNSINIMKNILSHYSFWNTLTITSTLKYMNDNKVIKGLNSILECLYDNLTKGKGVLALNFLNLNLKNNTTLGLIYKILINNKSFISINFNNCEFAFEYIKPKSLNRSKSASMFNRNTVKVTPPSKQFTFKSLLQSLYSHDRVQNLCLMGNGISDGESLSLISLLRNQNQNKTSSNWKYTLHNPFSLRSIPLKYNIRALSYIDLSHNYLGKKFTDEFVPVLETDIFLRKLDLSYNEFEYEQCEQYAKALKTNHTLINLTLNYNPGYLEKVHIKIIFRLGNNIKYVKECFDNGEYTEEEFKGIISKYADQDMFAIDNQIETPTITANNNEEEMECEEKEEYGKDWRYEKAIAKIKQLEIKNEKLKNFVMKKNKRAESCGNYENSSYI